MDSLALTKAIDDAIRNVRQELADDTNPNAILVALATNMGLVLQATKNKDGTPLSLAQVEVRANCIAKTTVLFVEAQRARSKPGGAE